MRTIILATLLLVPNISNAQILWDIETTQPIAQGYQYKLYVTPPNGTAPSSIVTLTAVTCADGAAPGSIACNAPIQQAAIVGATNPGAQSQLTATDIAGGFAESPKSDVFIFQVDCTVNPVKLNVGTWTRSIPTNGVGQVLYNLRQSTSNIVQVVVKFNGVVQDTLQGTKLNNVAGSYFVANVPSGSYQLTVQATDANGCTDGGASRPMTVTVQ